MRWEDEMIGIPGVVCGAMVTLCVVAWSMIASAVIGGCEALHDVPITGSCEVQFTPDGEQVFVCGLELGHTGPHRPGVDEHEDHQGLGTDGPANGHGRGELGGDERTDHQPGAGRREALPMDTAVPRNGSALDRAAGPDKVGPARTESSVKGLTPIGVLMFNSPNAELYQSLKEISRRAKGGVITPALAARLIGVTTPTVCAWALHSKGKRTERPNIRPFFLPGETRMLISLDDALRIVRYQLHAPNPRVCSLVERLTEGRVRK